MGVCDAHGLVWSVGITLGWSQLLISVCLVMSQYVCVRQGVAELDGMAVHLHCITMHKVCSKLLTPLYTCDVLFSVISSFRRQTLEYCTSTACGKPTRHNSCPEALCPTGSNTSIILRWGAVSWDAEAGCERLLCSITRCWRTSADCMAGGLFAST
jgi:hypothetical protein